MSKPVQLENGRVVVTRTHNFVEWCAWREWLHMWTGRTVFLEKLAVWADWPPETQALADKIIGHIRDVRREVKSDVQCSAYPQPWQRWSAHQRLDCERRHREDFHWNPPLPTPKVRLRTVRGPDSDPAAKNWFDLEVEKLPPVLPKETLHAYRVRNHFRHPERKRARWEESQTPAQIEEITEERKAQLHALRERAEALAAAR